MMLEVVGVIVDVGWIWVLLVRVRRTVWMTPAGQVVRNGGMIGVTDIC